MSWQFRVSAEKNMAYELSEHLEAYAPVVSLFENPEDQTIWIVEGTCEEEPSREALEDLLKRVSAGAFLPVLDIMKLPDVDWVAENRKDFPPLEIAGFYIYGSHVEDPQWGDNIPLKIDASTAFGTGSHGTTHGCLSALQHLKAQGVQPKNPLDLGCGTGILALGIIKLFNVQTLATDCDPEATSKAFYNAQENDAAELMVALTADGLDHKEMLQKSPFDLIVANILAGPLMDMAPAVKRALSQGGNLVLSGILSHQAEAVKVAYCDATVTCDTENHWGDWVTLLFKKQPA